MNIDLNLKTYEQLQNEVITLITNSYLKDLKIKQLQTNWNILREWLEEQIKHYSTTDCQKEVKYEFLRIADKFTKVLDKMNELEGADKND